MNEQIRQLAKQVHVTGDPWKNKDEPEYLWFNFREDALQQFAELIVRECVSSMPLDMDPAEFLRVMRAVKNTFRS